MAQGADPRFECGSVRPGGAVRRRCLQVSGAEREDRADPRHERAGMARVVRDRIRDLACEEAPGEDYDPQRRSDGPGAREGARVQRAPRGDVSDPWRRLRGEVREDPEHRRHGRRRGEELRPARPRSFDGVAAHPVRLWPDARSDCPPDRDAHPDGPQSPPPRGAGSLAKSVADPGGPAAAAHVGPSRSRPSVRRSSRAGVASRCENYKDSFIARRIFLAPRGWHGRGSQNRDNGPPRRGQNLLPSQSHRDARGDGLKVGGMITEPIVKRNRREGFYVMDWATKEKRVFASREITSKTMVGRYGVDISALEEVGVNALRGATANADVIVIDEVGKMEVESPNFVLAVKDALDADKPLLLTLHKKSRNPLLQDIRRRDDVRILEVTMVNRNLLPYKIVKLMKGEVL